MTDFVLFVLWIVAFGLLVNFIGPLHCGSIWAWGNITQKGTCERWKAAVAFCFLSAIFWLVSALVVCFALSLFAGIADLHPGYLVRPPRTTQYDHHRWHCCWVSQCSRWIDLGMSTDNIQHQPPQVVSQPPYLEIPSPVCHLFTVGVFGIVRSLFKLYSQLSTAILVPNSFLTSVLALSCSSIR